MADPTPSPPPQRFRWDWREFAFAVLTNTLGGVLALARIAAQPTGLLTDAERQTLLDRARDNLAKATGETLENAGWAMHQAADEGEFTLQAGNEFATVSIYGRLLVVMTRAELRGICHPDAN